MTSSSVVVDMIMMIDSSQQQQQQQPRTVSISIPSDAEPGDTLSFVIEGTQLELVVPDGCQPGDVLQVQLATTTTTTVEPLLDAKDKDDEQESNAKNKKMESYDKDEVDEEKEGTDEMISIRLSSGNDLILATTKCDYTNQQNQEVAANECDNHPPPPVESIRDDDDASSCNDDGTHAMQWHAGRWFMECLTSCNNNDINDSWLRSRIQEEFMNSLIQSTDNNNDDDGDITNNTNTITVLELGSGLGGLGMVFACEILNQLAPPQATTTATTTTTELVLTDVPSAMPLLQYNLRHNMHLFASHVHASAHALTWTTAPAALPSPGSLSTRDLQDVDVSLQQSATTIAACSAATSSKQETLHNHNDNNSNNKFDWIIGSDLLYNPQSIPALVETLHQYLHPTRGRLLLAVRWRKPDAERFFFQQMITKFPDWHWELLCSPTISNSDRDDDNDDTTTNTTATMLSCPLSWQDFGNVMSEQSNRYFYSTCIAIHAKHNDSNTSNSYTATCNSTNSTSNSQSNPTILKPLCDITDDDIQSMKDAEYQAWERAHIQFYLGRQPRSQQHHVVPKSKRQRR